MEDVLRDLIAIVELAYFKLFEHRIINEDDYRAVVKELKELKRRLDKATRYKSDNE